MKYESSSVCSRHTEELFLRFERFVPEGFVLPH